MKHPQEIVKKIMHEAFGTEEAEYVFIVFDAEDIMFVLLQAFKAGQLHQKYLCDCISGDDEE